MTNNQAETYALLQGLSLVHQWGIWKLLVFGDSTVIVRHMIHDATPKDNELAQVNFEFEPRFESVEWFYTSARNEQADTHANLDTCKN